MRIGTTAFVIFCSATLAFSQRQQVKTNNNLQDSTRLTCFFPKTASFPGGNDSMKAFVYRHLKYPKQDIEGKVFVQFTIMEDGTPTDFKIAKGLSDECDKNALEALKKMPKWIPSGVRGNEPERYTLPIIYKRQTTKK